MDFRFGISIEKYTKREREKILLDVNKLKHYQNIYSL